MGDAPAKTGGLGVFVIQMNGVVITRDLSERADIRVRYETLEGE